MSQLAVFLSTSEEQIVSWESGLEPVPVLQLELLASAHRLGLSGKNPEVAREAVAGSLLHNVIMTNGGAPLGAGGVVVLIGVTLLVLSALILGFIQLAGHALHGVSWLGTQAATWSLSSLGIPVALILAGGFFAFRLYFRACYGLIEIAVACAVAWFQLPKFALNQMPEGFDTISLALGILAGSVYFMVRGMDNIHQGIGDDKLVGLGLLFWTKQRERKKSKAIA